MTLFPLARSVTNRRADGGQPELRSLMAHCLWLMDGSPPPAKRIHTAEPQAAVGIPLRLVFIIRQSILLAIIGACGEAIDENLCNLCNLWFDKISCPFVSIRGSYKKLNPPI